jgi:acetylglutamate kinase
MGSDAELLKAEPLRGVLKQVGQVTKVNTRLLMKLLADGLTPVVCPVGIFDNHSFCNINADLAAAEIAKQMCAQELIFLTDTFGVYNQQKKVVPTMTPPLMEKMISNQEIQGGMLAKVRSIQKTLEVVPRVLITHAQNISQLYETSFIGTAFVQEEAASLYA